MHGKSEPCPHEARFQFNSRFVPHYAALPCRQSIRRLNVGLDTVHVMPDSAPRWCFLAVGSASVCPDSASGFCRCWGSRTAWQLRACQVESVAFNCFLRLTARSPASSRAITHSRRAAARDGAGQLTWAWRELPQSPKLAKVPHLPKAAVGDLVRPFGSLKGLASHGGKVTFTRACELAQNSPSWRAH